MAPRRAESAGMAAARNFVRQTLETLGGKTPVIVFDDYSVLDRAVNYAPSARSSGQGADLHLRGPPHRASSRLMNSSRSWRAQGGRPVGG